MQDVTPMNTQIFSMHLNRISRLVGRHAELFLDMGDGNIHLLTIDNLIIDDLGIFRIKPDKLITIQHQE